MSRHGFFFARRKLIHSNDYASSRFDGALIGVGRLLDLALHPSCFNCSQHASSTVHPIQQPKNLSLDLTRHHLDGFRPADRIDRVCDARFPRDDLLCAKSEPGCVGRWQCQRFILRIRMQRLSTSEKRGQGFPPIELERTSVTGLKHLDGTLSMARAGPNTATSSFFICLGPQPALDFGGMRNPDGQGFAAFGRVVRGLDVARRIQSEPAKGQNLVTPIVIHEAVRK